MLLMVSAGVWLFVTVTFDAALFTPITSLPKEMLDLDTETAAMPVPLRLTVCGLLPPVSVTVSVPDRVPNAAGVNVTEIVQLLPAASFDGLIGHELVCVKSERLELMLVMVMAEVCPFFRVTF